MNNDHSDAELIDLGVASIETQGHGGPLTDSDQRPALGMGIVND